MSTSAGSVELGHTADVQQEARPADSQGVLTLAFSGFPPALTSLKEQINETVVGLPPEYSGSKWPKATLGCLRDKTRLAPEQLDRLNIICREMSAPFAEQSRKQAVLVDSFDVVFYECRCLERRLLSHHIRMALELDAAEPGEAERARVAGIVGEADAEGYWFHASKDGNREPHYRHSALGVTLVHWLAPFAGRTSAAAPPGSRRQAHGDGGGEGGDGGNDGGDGGCLAVAAAEEGGAAYGSALPGAVAAFRARVEAELPGMYTFFQDASLHVTLRSLMG